jgi:hypothetical protein
MLKIEKRRAPAFINTGLFFTVAVSLPVVKNLSAKIFIARIVVSPHFDPSRLMGRFPFHNLIPTIKNRGRFCQGDN